VYSYSCNTRNLETYQRHDLGTKFLQAGYQNDNNGGGISLLLLQE